MRPSTPTASRRRGVLWDFLTLETMLTGPITHLIYWAGLALIALLAFTAIGGAVGLAIRSGAVEGVLLALPALVIGLLVAGAAAILWRGACEFYMAVFRIADDLRALRINMASTPPPEPAPPFTRGV